MHSLLASHISGSRIGAVEKALVKTFGTTDVEAITQLSGGLSGSGVFKIIVFAKPYLLKLSVVQESLSAPPPRYYQLVSEARLAPTLYYIDAVTGVSISAFMNDVSIFSLPPEQMINELATTIKTVHEVKVEGPAFDLLPFVENVVRWLQQSNLFSSDTWEMFAGGFERIRKIYPWADGEKVLCHNDLNPSNTLWDGEKLWLIDWNVAAVNDRFVDLAVAANFFVPRPADEKQFLAVYFGKEATAQQSARFNVMRQVCRLIFAKEMLQRALQGGPAGFWLSSVDDSIRMEEAGNQLRSGKLSLQNYEGQFLFGKALFNEALQQMRSAQFAEFISCLSKSSLTS